MPIQPGQTLLHYRIVDKIGEGGMGVVWRAEDTSLGREVAIKVLPAAWAGDAERLQRFEREARLLASLNHPNVATVHGLHLAETPEGPLRFIAMEWVPGEDLAARLIRGPLEIGQALQISRRIAQGLEAAHAAGVVHRDLKPANIRLTPDGKVKVLDFGLAKGAVTEAPGGDPQLSPTMTSAGTQAGMVLGTAAYMSPEQAKGHPVDKRADVWAFGVVLFEMLTGSGAFRGDSIADTMASVLKLEPDFDRLPPDTPAAIRRVLRRCLQKDPDRRLRDVADARIEIEEADLEAPAPAEARQPAAPGRLRLLPLLAAAALGLAAGALLWSWLGRDATAGASAGSGSGSGTAPVRRSLIPLPPGAPLNRGNSMALSPDGSVLAIAAGLDDQSRIYLRRLDSFETQPIPGTQQATAPFFSPDGQELGFFAAGELKKISLRGGAHDVTVLCDAPTSWDGAWDESGWIYFLFGETRLGRVRAEGGDPEVLGASGKVQHISALPGGHGILLTLQGGDSVSVRKDVATLAVLLPDGTTIKPVLEGGYQARYLPGGPGETGGHLVFMRGGGLFAVPFDLKRLEATPPAVSVQPDVVTDSIWARARFDVASDGTLVYVAGGDWARTVPTWIDLKTGDQQPLPIPPAVRNNFNLSPDGTRLAIQDASGAQDHIWVYDSRRQTFTRLTEDGSNINPVWSHDGREVFFASNREGRRRLYRKPIDGSAPASRLLTEEQGAVFEADVRLPTDVTPDGKFLLIFTWGNQVRGADLWRVPLDGAGDPRPVLTTEANEIIPQASPDGRWIAYSSDRMGPYRVMVRPAADDDRREWVLSAGDAYDPRWSPRGDALLYRQGWGGLMSVPIAGGDAFSSGVAARLFETDFHDSAGSSFAVSPDGKRVLVNMPVGMSQRDETPITLVTGWASEVARATREARGVR